MTGITSHFRNYLIAKKISLLSVKNYLADVRHFLNFKGYAEEAIIGLPQVEQLTGIFSAKGVEDYKQKLRLLGVSSRTINRRLSSLRQFGQFLVSQSFLSENPAVQISNLPRGRQVSKEEIQQEKTLKEFKNYLWEKGTSKLTMKNYLADMRQFLNWMEKVSS